MLQYKVEFLAHSKGQGYYISDHSVRALRLVVLPDKDLTTKPYEKAYEYWHRICGAEWTHSIGTNMHWRLRLTTKGFEFEAYNIWLTGRGITDVKEQKDQALPKMEKVLKAQLHKLMIGFDYLPRERPDIAIVQAQLFKNNIAETLRGRPLDKEKILKFLKFIEPTVLYLL